MDEHKEVFEDMMKVCRPQPVENQTFKSEWGDTTKTGDMKAWAKSMLKTHNQCVNEHAAKQNADLIKENRERFHKDVRRKQLYYADLLSDGAAADVDEYLKNASYEDKEEFLSAFRDMHAGSAEHRNRQTSVTQEKFKQGYRPSSADGARVKEFSDNKQKLRGPTIHPRELDKLKAAKERRMAKEAAEVAARKEAVDAKLRAIAAKKGTSAELFPEKRISARPDTFDSGFTLGWVGTDPGETNQSAYQEHHGGNYSQILKDLARGKEEKAFASTANNYNNITAPYGEVNYLNQEEPDKCYPVAKNFFQSKPHYEKLCQQELRTTNRSAFPVRARNEGVAQAESALKAAAAARAMRTKSSVPLGRQGIMDHPRHQRKTTYKSEFVGYEDAGPQMGKPSITAHS